MGEFCPSCGTKARDCPCRVAALREVRERVRELIYRVDDEDEDREAGMHSQKSVHQILALFAPGGPLEVEETP